MIRIAHVGIIIMIVNNALRLMAPCEGGEDWLGSSGGALDMVMRDGLSNYTFSPLPSQQHNTPNLSCSVPLTGSSPKRSAGLKLCEVPLRCFWCASLSLDGAEKTSESLLEQSVFRFWLTSRTFSLFCSHLLFAPL